jgi:hypothetical protein
MSKAITITLTESQANQTAMSLGLVSFLLHGLEKGENPAIQLKDFLEELLLAKIDHNELYQIANRLGFDNQANES